MNNKMKNTNFKIEATLEKTLIAREAATRRVIEIKLTAPNVDKEEDRHIPLNLALVIDRSGSMAGEKIDFVKQAARHVVSMLNEEDRVGLFIYDNVAEQLMPGLLMTEVNRARMMSAIDEIYSRGMTNLSDGWLMGCEEVGEHQDEQHINRVLLLSDGLANQGITSLTELGQHASALHERGVATSTFGVGMGFNENLLERISSHGGGNFYFIEYPNQITEIFLQELTELTRVSAKGVQLSSSIPEGATIEVLGGWRHEIKEGTINLFFGDMVSHQARSIYLIVTLPGSNELKSLPLTLTLKGTDHQGEVIQLEHRLEFSYASMVECEKEPYDKEMMSRYGGVHLSDTTREAIKLERMGRRHEAQQMMTDALEMSSDYLSEDDRPKFTNRRDRIQHGLSEAERKRMHYRSYRRSQSRPMDEDEKSAEE